MQLTMKKIFYHLAFAVILFSSCQKDLEFFVPDPGQVNGPDSTWHNVISNNFPVAALKNTLLLPSQKDSFIINTNIVTLTTSEGLQCSFTAGSLLNSANQPATGMIRLESHLLKKKGDMIRMGTPTTSIGRMLVSGGAYYLRLIKDGMPLTLSQNGHTYVKYSDANVSGLMSVFNGVDAANVTFTWLPSLDTLNNKVTALNQSYEILSNRLGWINCDYFYDTTGIPRTTVTAVLPAYYTNANTVAYTVFNEMRSVIGMYGNETTRKFSTGKLPSNKQVTVVIISKQGDDYYLGHQQAITNTPVLGSNGDQLVMVTPVKTSIENIKAYLNTL